VATLGDLRDVSNVQIVIGNLVGKKVQPLEGVINSVCRWGRASQLEGAGPCGERNVL
jgi:hypothetical protein